MALNELKLIAAMIMLEFNLKRLTYSFDWLATGLWGVAISSLPGVRVHLDQMWESARLDVASPGRGVLRVSNVRGFA